MIEERSFVFLRFAMPPSPHTRLVVVVALVPALVILALAAFAWPSANLAPRDLPVGIVASSADTSRLSSQLGARFPGAFSLRSYATTDAVRAAIRNREVYGAIALDPSGNTLYVASANSALVTQLLTQELFPVVAA